MKQTIYLIAVCLMFPAFALAAGAGEAGGPATPIPKKLR